jgi:molybdopterin converting factor small subunit
MPEGATAEQLATRVGLDVEEVKIVFVNHREVELSHVLHDGDKVAMSPKTGGM